MTAPEPTQQFRTWLSHHVETAGAGERLPVDSELAAHWGISLNTVRREMTAHRNAGRLVRIAGKGTFIPDSSIPPGVPSKSASVTEDLVALFTDMIRRGEAVIGEALPAVKTVALQYRVSQVSVGRAYHELCAKGYATKVGKRFWVGEFKPYQGICTGKPVIYYYDPREPLSRHYSQGGESHAIVKMERELLKHGYTIRYRAIEKLVSDADRWLRTADFPHGAVYFFCEKAVNQVITKKIEQAYRSGGNRLFQIALSHDIVAGVPGLQRMLIKQHSFTMVCRRFAQFVCEKRYRRMAVFYGEPISGGKSLGGFMKFRNEIRHADPQKTVRYVVETPNPVDPEAFLRKQFVMDADGYVQGVLSKYERVSLVGLRHEFEFCSNFETVFKNYRDHDIWIFSRDRDAARALQWCNRNRIAVPQQVSLVSIENNPAYYHLGISSCAEDWETIGYMAAHAIIGDIPVAKTSKGYIRTDALLLERSTTR